LFPGKIDFLILILLPRTSPARDNTHAERGDIICFVHNCIILS